MVKKGLYCVAVVALLVSAWLVLRSSDSEASRQDFPHQQKEPIKVYGMELPDFADGEDVLSHTGYTASYNHPIGWPGS